MGGLAGPVEISANISKLVKIGQIGAMFVNWQDNWNVFDRQKKNFAKESVQNRGKAE